MQKGRKAGQTKNPPSAQGLHSPMPTSFLGALILPPPWSSLAPGGGKMRDPGNEATSTAINVEQLACFELKGTPKQFIGVLTAVF